MDCQMPEMDGFETSTRIRNGEAGEHYLQIPLIAMTANAMKGDRDRCLQAGMDDYISKPVDWHDMENKLSLWLLGNKPQPDDVSEQVPSDDNAAPEEHAIWDKDELLHRVRNKESRVIDLVQMFVDDMPERIMELKAFIQAQNHDASANLIHTMKGISGNISAHRLFEACKELEQCVKEQSLTSTEDPAFTRFMQTHDEALHALQEYLQSTT
jgi:CheY-like chemotaxis protein